MAWKPSRDAAESGRGAFGRFERRMAALAVLGLLVVSAIALQLARLSLVEHERHRASVERYLTTTKLLPAPRGRILDRRGEVLAADRASWDVLLHYDAITGAWSSDRARRALVKEMGRPAWLELSGAERAAAIVRRQEEFDAKLEQVYERLAEAGGVPRSEIDTRLDAVVARAAREVKSRKEAMLARATALEGEDARLSDLDRERVHAQDEEHVILSDVGDETAFAFQRMAEDLPGVLVVEPSMRRVRPWEQVRFSLPRDGFPPPIRSRTDADIVLDGVADHIVGSTRTQVFPEDLARRPLLDPVTREVVDRGGYRSDRDVIGASGIERRAEDLLRGTRGVVERDLERGTEERIEAEQGRDVVLTIDIRLQARLQALFAPESRLATIQQYQRGFDPEGNPRSGPLPIGWELDGAIVVIEVATGEIVAAVSSPTIAEGVAMSTERREREKPGIFRPFDAVYPPGSILKPLVLCAAVAEGVVRPDEAIECKGHYFPERNDAARCWIYRANEGRTATHGPLDAAGALARSCNIYFYALAARLGPDRLVAWLRRFGMAEIPDAGLAFSQRGADGAVRVLGEAAGSVPDDAAIARAIEKRDRMSVILLGIGQGALTWSPLQAAQAYATLARGGKVIPAHLVRGVGRGEVVRDLGIPREAIAAAMAGLRASVRENYGTGHHLTLEGGARDELFDIPGVEMWGKTGTATAPLLGLDADGDGRDDERVRTDHAWFVGMAGPAGGAPQYAIAVVLDHGGSGGKVAGPVAAETVRALAAEGYLGAQARGSGGNALE
ncbi:MAG: peptidoglycan D,D-transpeptidase FtsI family protein [Planctomycetota bacterium]